MADMETIRGALKTALDSNVSGCQISAYPASSPALPAIQVVGNDDIAYGDGGFGRGDDTWTVVVRALAALQGGKASVIFLDKCAASNGAGSVKAAIESDQTLGGISNSVIVMRASRPQPGETPDGVPVYFTDFIVQIQTTD